MVTERTEGPAPGSLAARIGLTLLGAAGLIVGPLLDWISGGPSKGTEVELKIFYSTDVAGEADFITSAGFVVLIVGLVAILGLALPRGWLSSLAGALGIVAYALFVITLFRAEGGFGDIGIGMWLILAGGLMALSGGFFGSRRVRVTTTAAPPQAWAPAAGPAPPAAGPYQPPPAEPPPAP